MTVVDKHYIQISKQAKNLLVQCSHRFMDPPSTTNECFLTWLLITCQQGNCHPHRQSFSRQAKWVLTLKSLIAPAFSFLVIRPTENNFRETLELTKFSKKDFSKQSQQCIMPLLWIFISLRKFALSCWHDSPHKVWDFVYDYQGK